MIYCAHFRSLAEKFAPSKNPFLPAQLFISLQPVFLKNLINFLLENMPA